MSAIATANVITGQFNAQPIRMDAADVAKLARKVLRAAFPGVTFSVKTSRYAGGSSVRVRWTDGPTVAMVDALVGGFHGCDFDSMQDLQTRRGAQHVAGVGLVEFGNSYIFTDRDLSPAFRARLEAYVTRNCGAGNKYEHENYVYRTSRFAYMVGDLLFVGHSL